MGFPSTRSREMTFGGINHTLLNTKCRAGEFESEAIVTAGMFLRRPELNYGRMKLLRGMTRGRRSSLRKEGETELLPKARA